MPDGIQSPLVDDVAVIVVMENGERLESPLMPGVIASDQKLAIRLHREKAANYERWEVPRWLPGDFDFSEVVEVRAEYQGVARETRRSLTL